MIIAAGLEPYASQRRSIFLPAINSVLLDTIRTFTGNTTMKVNSSQLSSVNKQKEKERKNNWKVSVWVRVCFSIVLTVDVQCDVHLNGARVVEVSRLTNKLVV